MATRYFALTLGGIYLLIGILGFFPALVTPPAAGAPELALHGIHGYLLGLFPVNVLHNIVHLLVGIWGIAAFKSFAAARGFSRFLAIFFGILAIMGLFPVLNVVFGLIPVYGHDIWLHALTAIAGAYFGWAVPEHARVYAAERRRT